MQNYKIMSCPSDNSTKPEVYEVGYTFKPAANDRAFELNGRADERDYWPEVDETLEL